MRLYYSIGYVINFMAEADDEENLEVMKQEISKVKTGQITYAVRDTVIDDIEIKKDDFMGLADSGILVSGAVLNDIADNTVEKLVDENSELISIYYGIDVSRDEAEEFRSRTEERFPDCDVELQYGGQPIYYYFISVE